MATSSSEGRQPKRLAIVSFAHSHVNTYAEAIKDFADARLVAAWDDDRERGQTQCAKYGIAFEPDLDTLLKRPDVDADKPHQSTRCPCRRRGPSR